jgi:SAM-dependent methyltransferase
MSDMLAWRDEETFVAGETTFRILPSNVFTKDGQQAAHRALEAEGFFILKPRPLVEHHAALIGELQPRNILELGFFQGGSTWLFVELARPRRVVAVDLKPRVEGKERIERHAAASGKEDVARIYGEVDQADRARLAEIVDESFGEGAELDLVVDDCSHLYEPTRASFNELFPRLRPGGVYVIEDWSWAHSALGSEVPEGIFPNKVPLTRLLFEIVLAVAGVPGLVSEISIESRLAVIRRGELRVDPSSFEISACSNPRGRALLAQEPPGNR